MVAKLQTLRVEAAGEAAEGAPGEGDAAEEGSGFGALVTGAWRERPRVEVPRAFAALLQLVNDGNVAVERGAGGTDPERFRLRLRSAAPAAARFRGYLAPSLAAAHATASGSPAAKKPRPAAAAAGKENAEQESGDLEA